MDGDSDMDFDHGHGDHHADSGYGDHSHGSHHDDGPSEGNDMVWASWWKEALVVLGAIGAFVLLITVVAIIVKPDPPYIEPDPHLSAPKKAKLICDCRPDDLAFSKSGNPTGTSVVAGYNTVYLMVVMPESDCADVAGAPHHYFLSWADQYGPLYDRSGDEIVAGPANPLYCLGNPDNEGFFETPSVRIPRSGEWKITFQLKRENGEVMMTKKLNLHIKAIP